jgi:hypothetical protein
VVGVERLPYRGINSTASVTFSENFFIALENNCVMLFEQTRTVADCNGNDYDICKRHESYLKTAEME